MSMDEEFGIAHSRVPRGLAIPTGDGISDGGDPQISHLRPWQRLPNEVVPELSSVDGKDRR